MTKKSIISNKALELAIAKLETSGLTIQDAKELNIEILSANDTNKLHPSFKSLCSLKLNYHDPSGKPISDWPQGGPFYRIRYLERETGFTSQTEAKEIRYTQVPDTAPVAYYPTNQTWNHIVDDPSFPICITEGELKASKACKEGFPTIGLGGVWNWKAGKFGISWIKSLDYINWVRRPVYIVFDSDYKTNENVCNALKQLAEQLEQRGAFPHVTTLSQVENFLKVGLDDFLTFGGLDSCAMFQRLLSESPPLGLTAPLFNFNDKYVYVQDPGMVVNMDTNTKISPSSFKDHLELPARCQEKQLGPDGSISYKMISAAAAWIKWPLRLEASKLTYNPGYEKFYKGMFNIWPGWGVEAAKGDIGPFLQLIDHVFKGVEKDAKNWFMHWCAYPLQYPGTKMFSSAVLHGIRHGTGKSLIGYTLGKIYGRNFTEINQMDIHASFNEWAEGKQFVMGDDVTGSNKRQDADYLKKLITQREIRINAKYIPSYTIPDCINYFFTANHPDSFFLEDDDRRFFICEVQVGPLDQDFYTEYDLWLDSGGAAAIHHYLKSIDLGEFNPAAPAFKTSAKERMIANVQSDLAGWVRQLMLNPDHILMIGSISVSKDLFTSKELLDFYDPMGKTGTTANGLGRELARAGVRQVCQGKPIRISDGSQSRYFAVRNTETWATVDKPAEVVKHLEGWLSKADMKKGKY